MLTFWIGLFLGSFLGLILAALLGVARSNEQHQDLTAAYRSGFQAGQQHPHPPQGDLP